METREFNQNSSSQATANRQVGQAVVEYIMLLALILSASAILYSGVSSTRDRAWKRILCVVSAACPDCKATESAKSALSGSGVRCKN